MSQYGNYKMKLDHEKQVNKQDYKDLITGLRILIRNSKENIKDARRALRHCTKSDKYIYRKVIRWNKDNIQDSKDKILLIRATHEKSFWVWGAMLLLCLLLFIFFPTIGMAFILAPIWVTVLLGGFVILFLIKR